MGTTREELALQVDEAEWGWLLPHSERGALVVVSGGLDLAEVGERMAADDSAAIQGWIDAGEIAKPTAGNLEAWNAAPDRRFRILVVSPYVLIQELVN